MKNYTLNLQVKLTEGDTSVYSPTYAINFEIKEKLPKDTDAEKYIRSRLAEELKRNFTQLDSPIDNFTDEKKAEIDPLTDNVPF